MTKAFLVVSVVFLLSFSALAQDTPKAELFGGYSYAGSGSHGIDASITANINRWFGIVADFGGQYARFSEEGFTEKIRTHTFLFGPRFSLRKKRAIPFAHALFGVSNLKTETTEFGPLFSFSDTGFGMALGGGLDIRLNDRIAIRAVEIDYLRTNFFGGLQQKGRLTAGLVVRFGKK
jgi:opacity protein-like surface antigen